MHNVSKYNLGFNINKVFEKFLHVSPRNPTFTWGFKFNVNPALKKLHQQLIRQISAEIERIYG